MDALEIIQLGIVLSTMVILNLHALKHLKGKIMRLSNNIKNLLNKSKESCLLAVDVYNKPLTSFKSGGFIVLMIIAWTSLFHAIFEKEKINYYYKESNDYFYKKDETGERLAWDISQCVKEYFKSKNKDYEPIRQNLIFFIKFRNQIEHRFMPELDDLIFGECQSLLNNYERILSEEFENEHILDDNIFFSLQFSYLRDVSRVPSKEFKNIKNQIIEFRENLPSEVLSDEKYSFNVFLIKASNKNNADYAIHFIHENDLDSETLNGLNRAIVIRDEKFIEVSNKGNFRSVDICKKVQKELSQHFGAKISFNSHHLNLFCNKYQIKFEDKYGMNRTNEEYCIYDSTFEEYSYKPKFIDFILKKLKDKNLFCELFPSQKMNVLGLFSTSEVTTKVRNALIKFYGRNIVFGSNYHAICINNYKIKPTSKNPDITLNEKYCHNVGGKKYAYTEEWVIFLIDELKDKENYLKMFPKQMKVFI